MTETLEILQPDFKDRKAGLVAFGIIQIVLGVICVLLTLLVVFAMVATAKMGQEAAGPASLLSGILIYGGLAAWFITMGIGSIRARRWARALTLVVSWVWMVGGIGGVLFMSLLMPDMYGQMAADGKMPPGAAVAMRYIVTGFMLVFYVVIPGILILFYQSRHVKATCDVYDQTPRWTDRCPLPVLALSILFGFWAASLLVVGSYNWVLPFFGQILSGMPGMAVALVCAVLLGYTSWATFRLRMAGWWCAVVLTFAWCLSTALTFARIDLVELYEKMEFPAEQIEMMKRMGLPQGAAMNGFMILWFAVFLAYLIYTRRYFKPAP